MSLKLFTLIMDSHDPYRNLALEEHLLKALPREAILLYLWQNAHTVVIGHNQNAFREVNLDAFLQDGGRLARRLSGGGAVYHDLGNLNFTFLMPENHFSVPRQMAVLVGAVRRFSLLAQMTGRNDAVIDGRKFSGNAYYHSGVNAYHHGTVLINTDGEKMKKYLSVSQKKLAAKAVPSVKSRVVNLKELNPEITVKGMQEALADSFQEVYGAKSEMFDESLIDWEAVESIRARIADPKYLLGRRLDFTFEREERFDWGEIQLQLKVENDVIVDARVYSDAMDEQISLKAQNALMGCGVTHLALKDALKGLGEEIARDILSVLEGDGNGL